MSQNLFDGVAQCLHCAFCLCQNVPCQNIIAHSALFFSTKLPYARKNTLMPDPASCSQCGQPLTAADTFCGGCGNPNTVEATTCPKCQQTIAANDRFCRGCGAARANVQIHAAPPRVAPQQPTYEGELDALKRQYMGLQIPFTIFLVYPGPGWTISTVLLLIMLWTLWRASQLGENPMEWMRTLRPPLNPMRWKEWVGTFPPAPPHPPRP